MAECKHPEPHDESPDDKATLDHVIDKMTPKELGDLAMAVASTSSNASGTSARPRRGSAAELILSVSCRCELSAPGMTKGECPASRV